MALSRNPLLQKLFLILPYLFLLLWFRWEHYSHQHPFVLFLWCLLSFLVGGFLWKLFSGRIRYGVTFLWLLISSLLVLDFIQVSLYRKFSEARFQTQVDRNTEQVKKRAMEFVQLLREQSGKTEAILSQAPNFSPEQLPIFLEERLSGPFFWGVYNPEGRLLAWHGPLPLKEQPPVHPEEWGVVAVLHQQFLRLKRPVEIRGNGLILVHLQPLAAEYHIQNRYLKSYNHLTDGLSIPPILLYNSQSTTTSPDLAIRQIEITPDFSISTLYQKWQYRQFLQNRVQKLHWWFEFFALVFLLCTTVLFVLDLITLGAADHPGRRLFFQWMILILLSGIAAMTVAGFSTFGAGTLFQAERSWFQSPGTFLFVSFLLLNAVFVLSLLVVRSAKTRTHFPARIRPFFSLLTILLSLWILFSYYEFIKTTLEAVDFNPVDYSLSRIEPEKASFLFGMLWGDLAVTLLLLILFFVALRDFSRKPFLFLTFLVVLVGSILLVSRIFYPSRAVPVVPSLLFCAGAGILAFHLSWIGSKLERMNPVSRFFVVLFFVSCISFVFYWIRFIYSTELERVYVSGRAKQQVLDYEEWTRNILKASQIQIDQQVQQLSMDSRVEDLAYRLWTATDLARYGLKSAVEIYNPGGELIGRFALQSYGFKYGIEALVGEEPGIWQTISRPVSLTSGRKTVTISARTLPSGILIALHVLHDYENLPFVSSGSPFYKLFRPLPATGQYVSTLFLNVYDLLWNPVFLSDPDLAVPIHKAREILRVKNDLWVEESLRGEKYRIYFFRMDRGAAALLFPIIAWRTHLVQLLDLFLYNLFWFSIFVLIFLSFFRQRLGKAFALEGALRFNFFQKLLLAFVVFSVVPMLLLSMLIRSYVLERKVREGINQAVNSFSVAARVVGEWLVYQTETLEPVTPAESLSDDLFLWIQELTQLDVTVYFDRHLVATSNREFYTAGLLPEEIQGETYVDLFLRGQKYSITPTSIGSFHYLNISGRIHRGRFKDEVITIPFLIDERSVEAEVVGLRENMMLVGAGLILFAVFLGYFLANRFTRPVEVLIAGTGEVSRGNLEYRIQERYRDEFDQLVRAFNTMATSLHDQQQVLERRRAYIEKILNHITTSVITIDSTMNVATMNPVAGEMLGVAVDYRGPIVDLLSDLERWKPLVETIREIMKAPETFHKKEITIFSTGKESYYRLIYTPLFQNEDWAGAILLIEDVSDIILSNRLSAYAEMARRVAHEVKNPLTPIQLTIEHLVKVYEDRSPDFEKVLWNARDVVLKQVKILRRLVSDFSQYGRPSVLHRSEVDLHAFISELTGTYEPHLPEGIEMKSRVAEDVPGVVIDAEKIRATLINIIENGLQAMDGSGQIFISAETTPEGFIKIEVKDTGKGIPAEILPKLFEPYFSTRSGGTGLGLAIARKNVEDHGGRIEVESCQDQGTTVRIFLPVR